MTRWTIVFCAAALAAILAPHPVFAQGNCPGGVCPLNRPTTPVESRVTPVQEMGPLEKKIVAIEKNALEKWYSGDPSAYVAMMGDDIGYFEPILDKRLDGRVALTKMYEALRGRVHADRFDMLNTRVQATDKMAILSFNLISIENGVPYRWNCTEAFAPNQAGDWKLIHSHWSQTKPSR